MSVRPNVVIGLAAMLLIVPAVLAQPPACVPLTLDGVEPAVRAIVTRTARGFDYRYRLDAKAPPSRILIRVGLEQDAMSASRIVAPAGWEVDAANEMALRWSTVGERPGIRGGTRVGGFRIDGGAPPNVVGVAAWGYQPDHCPDDERANKHARARTVGPWAHGDVSIASLPQRVDVARDAGWLDAATAARLRARAERAIRAESADRTRELEALLADLVANACRDFDCAAPKAITSEGFALLFFVAEDLRRR